MSVETAPPPRPWYRSVRVWAAMAVAVLVVAGGAVWSVVSRPRPLHLFGQHGGAMVGVPLLPAAPSTSTRR